MRRFHDLHGDGRFSILALARAEEEREERRERRRKARRLLRRALPLAIGLGSLGWAAPTEGALLASLRGPYLSLSCSELLEMVFIGGFGLVLLALFIWSRWPRGGR